ncbi:MAG: 5'-nucleotidase C-terminal domain-containing protein [Coriobacteriales bacterium]|nr:5'-nucleotidase C-terminal domain-containing protein [Coriobacteriales bacterium]
MKTVRTVCLRVTALLAAAMLAMLLLPCTSQAAEDDLAIQITYDKETYAAGEKVHATITGSNESTATIEDVSLAASVPDGFVASESTKTTTQSLAPGASIALNLTLSKKGTGTSASGSSTNNSKAQGESTAKRLTRSQDLAQTGDASAHALPLALCGMAAIAVAVVLVRRGRLKSTLVVLVAVVVACAGLAPAGHVALAVQTKRESVETEASQAFTYDGKGVDLMVTMQGTKVETAQEADPTQKADPTPTPDPTPDPTPTPEPTPESNPKTATIHVMYVNDTHGYYKLDDYNKAIGYAALKALKDKTKPNLLLDAGDTFHGQSFATVQKGESIARLMDAVGVDATTPGNHDWSYGDTRLQQLDAKYAFAILGANVTGKDGKPFFKQDYLVKDITTSEGATVRVGVLGVIDESFYATSAATYVEHVQPFANAATRASELAAKLRNDEQCDVVIALAHLRDAKQFVAKTKGLDAVVSGHQHILINNTSKGDGLVNDAQKHGVALVQADYYFHYVGTLDLMLSDADGNGTWDSVESSQTKVGYADVKDSPVDETVSQLTTTIESEEQETLSKPVGTSTQAYDYPFRNTNVNQLSDLKLSWEWLRTRDEPIGHVVTAAYLAATGADLALENAGGIRGGIPSGPVTYNDVLSISPYGNTLETRTLTGAALRTMLEKSLSIMAPCRKVFNQQKECVQQQLNEGVPMQQALEKAAKDYTWPDNSGNVLVLGGVQVTVDWSNADAPVITGITLVKGNTPLDDAATYTVALNSYLPTGANADYPGLSQAPLAKEWGTCEQALKAFIGTSDWENRVTALTGEVMVESQSVSAVPADDAVVVEDAA